jgi:hypothetical protein
MDQNEEDFQTMFLTGAQNARARREKTCGTAAAPDGIARTLYADPTKALVMTYFDELVSHGYAEWSPLDNGDVELRFFGGQVFLLADTTITRIA